MSRWFWWFVNRWCRWFRRGGGGVSQGWRRGFGGFVGGSRWVLVAVVGGLISRSGWFLVEVVSLGDFRWF